jgi:hypothetical protein
MGSMKKLRNGARLSSFLKINALLYDITDIENPTKITKTNDRKTPTNGAVKPKSHARIRRNID